MSLEIRTGGSGPRWWRRIEGRLWSLVGGPARLRVILLLAAVLALNAADVAAVGAVSPQLQQAMQVGNVQIGLLVTVSTGIGAVATIPAGILVDRVPRVRTLAIAVAIWSIATLVSGAAVSFPMLLLTRLSLGAVVATAYPAVASLAGDLFPVAERGRMFGYVLTGELLGAAIGFLVSGTLAAASWRVSFWVLAVPGLILAWLLPRLLPEPARGGASRLPVGASTIAGAGEMAWRRQRPTGQEGEQDSSEPTKPTGTESDIRAQIERAHVPPHEDRIVRDDPAYWPVWRAVRYVLSIPTNQVLIVASALGYFFFTGLRTFAVQYLRLEFGLGQAVASVLLVVIGAGAIIGVLLAGVTADKLIGRGHLTASLVVAGAAFLVAVVLFIPALTVSGLAVAGPLLFVAAAGIGGTNPPLDAARLDIMHSRLWGRAESVRTVLRSLFVAAAPLLFGVVSVAFAGGGSAFEPTSGAGASGLGPTFLVMLIPLAAAALLILLRARPRYPRDVATAMASERATGNRPTA